MNVDIRESRGAGLQLANTIMGVEVSGIIERCAKSVAGANVEVETVVDNVKFINLMNRSTEALSTGCYILPEGNKISIIGGLVSGQAIFPAYKPQFAQNVDGFKTENNGEYSFDQASNTVTISHGLAMTPASVDITPTSDLATTWFISDVNASTFTVTFSSAVSSGSFKWTASAY